MEMISLVGVHPQFVKEAMLNQVAQKANAWEHTFVYSRQRNDAILYDVFFEELEIPELKYLFWPQ